MYNSPYNYTPCNSTWTCLIARIGILYNRIPKGEFGLLTKGLTAERFKKLALKVGNDGLYASIDLTFQFLLGQGAFHSGQSVFQYQPIPYCEDSSYAYFLNRISEGIMFYETALIMDNNDLPITTRAAWAKNFALVGKVVSIQSLNYIHCYVD